MLKTNNNNKKKLPAVEFQAPEKILNESSFPSVFPIPII